MLRQGRDADECASQIYVADQAHAELPCCCECNSTSSIQPVVAFR